MRLCKALDPGKFEATVNGILQMSNCTDSSSLSMRDGVIITPCMLLLNWFLGALLCLFGLVMFHLAYLASFFGGTSELHALLTGFVMNDMLLFVLTLEKKTN